MLTQKDADWIANVIRDKMKELTEMKEDFYEASDEKQGYLQSLVKLLKLEDDKDIQQDMDHLNKTCQSAKENIEEECKEKLREYERILELLTVGSV